MCVYVLFPSSTSSTYIALQPLCIFDLSSTSLTYFNIHLLWLVLISSTSSTYIALQPLCVFDLSSTSSTYFNIHLGCARFAEILSELTKTWEFRRHRMWSLNRQLQCKSVKIYQAQTPQYLTLIKISAKRAHPCYGLF